MRLRATVFFLSVFCLAGESRAQQPLHLGAWVAEDYPVTGDSSSDWAVAPDGLSVTQTTNSLPSVFYGDFPVLNSTLEATLLVDTTDDDDFVGFALGFRPGDSSNAGAEFLLLDWKQSTQSFDFGCGSIQAPEGLAVSRLFGVPSGSEFWGHVNVPAPCGDPNTGLEELQRGLTLGNVGWADGQVYLFRFEFCSHSLRVFVDGILEIDITGDFEDGRFGFYGFSQRQVVYDVSASVGLGTNYCLGTINSTGAPSNISATGSDSVSANNLVLMACNMPDQPGIFIAGPSSAQVPFFNGFLCIDPNGLQRFSNTTAASGGVISEAVDIATSAPGGLNVVAGSSYFYQRWYRDPMAGGGNANFSDGIEINYTP